MAQQNSARFSRNNSSFFLNRFSQHGFFDNLIIQRNSDGLQTARVRGIPGVRPQRWWFRQMIKEHEPFISPSFYSFSTDIQNPSTAVGLFFPVYKDGAMAAVMAALLRIDEIKARAGWYYRGDERFIYLLDHTGTVIVHPEAQQEKEHYNYLTGQKALVARDAAGKTIILGEGYQLDYYPVTLPQGLMEASAQALKGFQRDTEYQDGQGNTFLCTYTSVALPANLLPGHSHGTK